ncbi:MAG: B12-binding domain-containing radical SAM protein [Candidatus Cloacimonetes bacterium]|nr:B12-binding domain-containing radical SAM protein [Candidatus Cloacimonadota bacterium]
MINKGFKVLFLNSRFFLSAGITHLPLIIAYPATILKSEGYGVKVIDLAIESITDKKIFEKINDYNPNLIVINSETTVLQTRNFFQALDLTRKVKKSFPKIDIAMIGAHVTFRDRETLERNSEISFIIKYEPDYVLLDLVRAIKNGDDFSKIKGLTYRENKIIQQNEDREPIINLDELPIPDRTLFPIDKYLKKDIETTIQGGRGCTNHCYFCQSSAFDRNIRLRSVASLVKEVRETLALGFKSIFFSDLDFGANEERLREFCRIIIKERIKFQWNANIRADRIKDTKEGIELLRLMKKSGCYRLFIGFESVSAMVLQNVKKGIVPNQLTRVAKLLKDNKINLHASFLFGLPGDTEDKIRATVKFAKRINPQMVSFNILIPFPGTMIGDTPEKFGIKVVDKYWYEKSECADMILVKNKELTAKKLRELGAWAYKEIFS